MGLDFIRRTAPSFWKRLDRGRVNLATPHLFSRQPSSGARRYAARIHGGVSAAVGEALCVHLDAGKVCILRGLDPIATIENPPPELVDALVACEGEAAGVVEVVHEIAHVAEMTIC